MSETTCDETADYMAVYNDHNCRIRLSDPDNYCEVGIDIYWYHMLWYEAYIDHNLRIGLSDLDN